MVKNGFDVVQLSKVFPELVSENTDGSVYIDYLGLIPVLVNVINEQSEILEAMGMKVREISEMNSVYIEEDSILLLNKVSKQNNSVETKAFLYQNTPNPFSNLTEIKYFIPNSANNAYIYIFNMQGDMLYSECLENKGYSSITIDAFSLNAGIYLYSLYVDGIEIVTKKMVLTK
ncbi:MAG: T9SS type A sorting domain-containing protein [Bacteroidales bacterium]|nr:T9SS type A sorting domain-containing protein [Bacteroidales bacterium]